VIPGLVGAVLALVVCGLVGTVARLDRDRAFYATVTIVVATYDVLFAVMGASPPGGRPFAGPSTWWPASTSRCS
jgi:hypothetical protein